MLDENKKPVPGDQLGGKATVLVGGKSQAVVLAPGEANSLTGKLPTAAAGKTTTVLSLTVSGKAAHIASGASWKPGPQTGFPGPAFQVGSR